MPAEDCKDLAFQLFAMVAMVAMAIGALCFTKAKCRFRL